jgi:4-hydroxy-tetrahydrodipicolinate synthase
MYRPTGSWVAMPTPFTPEDHIDFAGFEVLIDRQIRYGTSALFVLGSCGETTLLTMEEKKRVVREVVKMAKGRMPVFFNASAPTTGDSISFARYCEEQGADGVIFTVPPYVLIPQSAVFEHLDACMGAVSIPCGIYNNPARVGVNVEPETIAALSQAHDNFVADKEAVGDVSQLVQVKRLCGERINLLCCDAPGYSIVLPTLAVGGQGTANIGGNIIPEEQALFSRPWDSIEKVVEARNTYFRYFPLLRELYSFSNPIVVKAAMRILGLPVGHLRRPYRELDPQRTEALRRLMEELGVLDKYGLNR